LLSSLFSFCFFLLFRRPPSFTLFPYTTLFRSDRTGGPVRRGLGRLYPGKPRSLIRRGLLAVGAGVPLLALVTVLALVFRNVVLGPEMPRPGGTFVEGLVGQLGSLNPLYGEATAGSNDLDALLFEPLVR